MILAWLFGDAHACGVWHMKDLERGGDVRFLISSVSEDGQTVLRIDDAVSDELAVWQNTAAGAPVPVHLRWDWAVTTGDPLSMDGTLMLRAGEPVGEWLGTDLLRLGTEQYDFTLTPTGRIRAEHALFQLVVERQGVRILEGTSSSLCLNPMAFEDQLREIRTRASFWLAQTRQPVPLRPVARRVPAIPQPSASPPLPLSVQASSSLEGGYVPERLLDGDPRTAWCEGAPEHGTGETLTLTLDQPADPVLLLTPGYHKDALRLTGNAQPRRLLARTDTGSVTEISLPYQHEPGAAAMSVPLDAPGTRQIELEIVEVWPGARWSDTCLSEVGIAGRG